MSRRKHPQRIEGDKDEAVLGRDAVSFIKTVEMSAEKMSKRLNMT